MKNHKRMQTEQKARDAKTRELKHLPLPKLRTIFFNPASGKQNFTEGSVRKEATFRTQD